MNGDKQFRIAALTELDRIKRELRVSVIKRETLVPPKNVKGVEDWIRHIERIRMKLLQDSLATLNYWIENDYYDVSMNDDPDYLNRTTEREKE